LFAHHDIGSDNGVSYLVMSYSTANRSPTASAAVRCRTLARDTLPIISRVRVP